MMFLISLSIPWNTVAAVSDVWLWIRLFLCFHRWYNVWIAIFLRVDSLFDDVALIQDKSSAQLVKIVCGGLHLRSTSLQISWLYSQESSRWSLVSSKREQNGHVGETGKPHSASLHLVGSLSFCFLNLKRFYW